MKQKLTAKEEQLMNLFWEHGDLFIRDLYAGVFRPTYVFPVIFQLKGSSQKP